MLQPFISQYKAQQLGTYQTDEPLASYTTWKIGGSADLLIEPLGKEQLALTVKLLHEHQIPWMTIGRGSNLLVADTGFRGAVILLGTELDYVHFEESIVRAGGRYSLIKLSIMAGKKGLTGLEFAGGIPGTVGGAVYMNAGALGSDVSRIFESAEIVLETGELVRYSKEDMQFAYRHSVLHDVKGIVLEATFRLECGDRNQIATTMSANKEHRLRTQPLQTACAGSVFRNPSGDYAARLIQEAGLKGYRIGGAEVSTQHANFIVNTGQATASDVLTLIERIQQTIRDRFGVALVPEVLLVGER
ncbi:UDP-N-acetylmuramate dehydrogenase [Paenibacillus sp. 481]|uniref:UDP-N-acetylmuramate dehydrogenase n=1 Tax=Paenibacillus sp. 481 TaxID=2835869 RepID=UPI001E502628|nr:UDP-N-acetylmuramate dehydrogenase [Paenibacillus sp. 481]UHA74123.1 UDP-N-acetylmuramate dehydrogenase [Paenibacillus sp. 481]